MDSQNFTNRIKNNTCFEAVGSSIDLILTENTALRILQLVKPELVITSLNIFDYENYICIRRT